MIFNNSSNWSTFTDDLFVTSVVSRSHLLQCWKTLRKHTRRTNLENVNEVEIETLSALQNSLLLKLSRRSKLWKSALLKCRYCITSILSADFELKPMFSIKRSKKFSFNLLTTNDIQLLTIFPKWIRHNATTRYTIRSCWSLLKHSSTDDIIWKTLSTRFSSSRIIIIWRSSWKSQNYRRVRFDELKNCHDTTSVLIIVKIKRIQRMRYLDVQT